MSINYLPQSEVATASSDNLSIDTPYGSYSRFSSDMQREESLTDQQRKCREKAELNGHQICPHLEFSDEAVSGTKRHRDGLDAMLHAAETGRLQVLYIHSLSRLSRESVITLPILKGLVYNQGVRVISISEGIDTSVNGWELIAQVLSIVHERYVKDLAANVLRGQEGTVLAGLSVGDHCFGFTTQPLAGEATGSSARHNRPRMVYMLDPETAAWVERIFHWFVHERRSIRWIARELNRLKAPKDHRSTTPNWRHQYVSRLLGNRKYIGIWPWGKKRNVRDPLTGNVRQEDRPSSECAKWERNFPHLRLVDDATFEKAQNLLAENRVKHTKHRRKNGQLKGSGEAGHPRHLLSGIIACGECGRSFNVGGAHGKYLFCPGYHQGSCSCKTQLRRDRAERMILDAIGHCVISNDAWQGEVYRIALVAWKRQEATVPSELAAAQRSLRDVERRIENLLNQIESGRGGPELDDRLAQRRAEREERARRVESLRRLDSKRSPEPTKAWLKEQLGDLTKVLRECSPAATHALRSLIGGQTVVQEIKQTDRSRHFLRGRFRINATMLTDRIVDPAITCDGDQVEGSTGRSDEFVIDFRDPAKIEEQSEEAKRFYDEGLPNALIAERMGISRSRITTVLHYWFESRGLVMPDGRSRRATLQQKHMEPPLYQRVADEVMQLYDQRRLLQDIATALKIDRNTVTAAIRWWHESQGLSVPDGRTRRRQLREQHE